MSVYGIEKQLPPRNHVGLALDWWTSTKRLALTSVIGHYMNRKWDLRQLQLTFDEVDSLLF